LFLTIVTRIVKGMTFEITIGGDLTVHQLGFGAMRLSGPDGIKTARRAVELGVTFIDTADAYDLGLNEELLAEALHPYGDVVVATKAGHCHPDNDWIPCGRPEYLRQQCELSLRRLKLDCIDLFQLHRVDPLVPLADQIGALRRLQDEGKVRHVGLSEVPVEQIAAADAIVPIVSVQNRYNLADRASEDVLKYCEERGIAFIPWLPIKRNIPAAAQIARRIGATEAQVALAWLLRHSPVMLPIPGTSSIAHLEENCAATEVTLSDDDYALLTAAA
jgi:aryl-alcohol dehydrogenase-like predicted oxidoreductase